MPHYALRCSPRVQKVRGLLTKLVCSFAQTVKGRAKCRLRRKELWSTWHHNSYRRGLIMGAPSVLECHGSFNLMLVFSIPGAALGDPTAIPQPQGCTSGTAPERGNSPSWWCQDIPALSKGSTAGGLSPQHTHAPTPC